MNLQKLIAAAFAASLYTAGCGGKTTLYNNMAEDGGAAGESEDANDTLQAINETNHVLTWIETNVVFAGRTRGQPAQVYWDIDHRDGDENMDVLGHAVEEGSDSFVGDMLGGYHIPGRYTNTMYASTARELSPGSPGLVTILDKYEGGRVNSMGESLEDLFGGIELERIETIPYATWTDSVQRDSRYTNRVSNEARAALAAYQRNLSRPFGTKDIAQVRVGLGHSHDDGRVIVELRNPSIYANMSGVFETIWIGREDAEALLEIIDTL